MDKDTKKILSSIGEESIIAPPEATDVYYGDSTELRESIDKKGLEVGVSDYEKSMDHELE